MNDFEKPGCLGFLFRLFGASDKGIQVTQQSESFPYRVRDDFLSPAEISFYHVLVGVLADRALVCPKVGLGDIFFVTKPHENRAALSRIAQKHVDFLACEPGTMKPLFGVELDDASHTRPDRQKRDEFVEGTFKAASLPLIRIPVQRAYNVQNIATLVDPILTGQLAFAFTPAEAQSETIKTETEPLCPKCGIPMRLRSASRGERVGQQFYGCTNYPKCRQTLPA